MGAPGVDSGRRGAGVVAALLLVAVTLLNVAISRGVFLYGDDTLMFQVTRSIVEDRDVRVTSPTWNEVADNPALDTAGFTAASIPGVDGARYAKYGVGQSLVAIPAFIAGTHWISRLLPLDIRVDAWGNEYTGTPIYAVGLVNALIGGTTVVPLFLLSPGLG